MDVHALEYLQLIAETGSVSAAAEKANLSQPAMTQCLNKLEKEAGRALFTRKNRRLVPTRAGQIYLDAAGKMISIKEETYRGIEELKLSRDQLRITGSAGINHLLTEKLLPKLRQQFPQVKVEQMVTTTRVAKQYLANGLADMSFLSAVHASSLLEYTELTRSTLCLAVPKDMATPEIRRSGLAACGDLPFLLPEEKQFGRELVDSVLDREHLYPAACYTADSWDDIASMADGACGAALLPERSAAGLKNCEVFALENAPSFAFVCAVPRYTAPSPACRALIGIAREYFASSDQADAPDSGGCQIRT